MNVTAESKLMSSSKSEEEKMIKTTVLLVRKSKQKWVQNWNLMMNVVLFVPS